MEDPQRVPSARNSRRRRWEVKSKESFETSLAVEIDSPEKRESRSHVKESKDNKARSDDEIPRGKTPDNFEHVNTDGGTKLAGKPSSKLPSSKPSSARSSKPSSARSKTPTSKPSSARAKTPVPKLVKSKPSSAKSVLGVKPSKPKESSVIDDLLSAKLGALIDEAKDKTKDYHKRPPEEKDKIQCSVDPPVNLKQAAIEKEIYQILDDPILNETEKPSLKDGFVSVDMSREKEPDDKKLMIDYPTPEPNNMITPYPILDSVQRELAYSSPEPSAPPLSPSAEGPPKKKKRKKKSDSKLLLLNAANEESFISLQLKEMKDDIIDITEKKKSILESPTGLLRASSLPTVHGNINAIFEERIGGFVMTSQCEGAERNLNERLQDVTQIKTRTSHAVFIQSGFRTFSVLCQGLLAGLTLAHCLTIFLLDAEPSTLTSVYNPKMAHIFYALVIFLTTICFTSACDRCDLSGVGVVSGHGIKIPWTPAFYLSSLVLSLVAIRTEDVLTHIDLYIETLQKEEVTDLVNWWRWICVARSATAVLAWLAVVPDPHTDALLDSIQALHQK